MKIIFTIIFIILFISCKSHKSETIKAFEKLKSCNFRLFLGVRLQIRTLKNGEYIVPHFKKEIDGIYYLLPNYSFYNCQINDIKCLKDSTKINYDIFEFANANNVSSEDKALEFTGEYINKIMSEFKRIEVIQILSDSKIGNCIVFFYSQDKYIAFVPDTNEVNNKYWKTEFIKKNKIEENWYSNMYNK